MRRTNMLGEYDENSKSFYVYLPPYHPKNNSPKIIKSEQLDSKIGVIVLDWAENNKLAGIEIINGKENIDLSQLNLNEKV